jgi:hypothetical protein
MAMTQFDPDISQMASGKRCSISHWVSNIQYACTIITVVIKMLLIMKSTMEKETANVCNTLYFTVWNIELNGKFLRFRRDGVSKPISFYKAGIEKLVTRWKTVIASNGNYIID